MAGTSRYAQMYAPLRIPNYRNFIAGQTISTIGSLIQMTAQSWVVYELTQSTAALGWVTMLGSLPMLILGPFAGSIADRVNRRLLLIGTQAILAALAATLALLVQLQVVQIWHIYVLAVITGIVTAVDMPALQAFSADLTGTAMIRQAVTLNSMAFQMARTVGPSLAGVLLGTFGNATAFWVNAVSFVAVIIALSRVRFDAAPSPASERVAGSPGMDRGGAREAIAFVLGKPPMIDLYLFSMLFVFLVFSTMTVYPAFVASVLHGDGTILGLLGGASGAGSLTCTLMFLPLLHAIRRTGLLISGALLWFGVMLFTMTAVASWAPTPILAVGEAFGIANPIVIFAMCMSYLQGMAGPVVLTTSMGLLQQMSPGHMRARLLGLSSMITFGMQPFAALFVGYSGELFGSASALATNGLLLITGAIAMIVLRPSVRASAPSPSVVEPKRAPVHLASGHVDGVIPVRAAVSSPRI